MNDIERAAELASTVLPGPIGEAVAVVLGDHEQDEHPDPNIHELAYRIIEGHRVFDLVSIACPDVGDQFFYGLASAFLSERDVVKTAEEALRLAEIAVRYLVSMAPYVHPDEDESREPVNLVGHLLMLTAVNRQLRAAAEAGA